MQRLLARKDIRKQPRARLFHDSIELLPSVCVTNCCIRKSGRNANKNRIRTLALLAIICLVSLGCQNPNSGLLVENSEPDQPVTVNAIAIERVDRTTTTTIYFGSLQPKREQVLRFQASAGEVKRIPKLGEIIEKDAVLVELELVEQQQQKSQLESQLELAVNSGQQTRAEQLRKEIQQLESQSNGGQIVAPFSGIITDLFLDEGAVANAGAPVVKIVDVVDPQVKINLPRQISNWIDKENVQITFVIDENPYQGKFDRKSVTQNPAGSSETWFTINGSVIDNGWAFGQNVEARFDFDEPNSGFWLPLSAVQRAGPGLWSVLVVDFQSSEKESVRKLQKRIVTVKKFEASRVFVDGDVLANEYVVADGLHRVVPNQQVQINPRPFRTADQSGAGR